MSIKKPWRYKLTTPVKRYYYTLRQISFSNEWVQIQDGFITVKAGYAWDGCSPAWKIPFTHFWLGVWDGPLETDGRPSTFTATLMHDALCQFRYDIDGLTRDMAIDVFTAEIKSAPFIIRKLYPIGIKYLGPQYFLGDSHGSNK